MSGHHKWADIKHKKKPSLSERKATPTTTEIGTVGTDACPYGECDGSGKISYVEREHPDTKKPLGDDYYIGPATLHGSRLCRCRKELEPRDGEARWWESETVYAETWESSVHRHQGEIVVKAEVPISDDNYVLKRTGDNRYYPCFVDVDFDEDWLHALFPEEARALAALLVAAADKCEEIDLPNVGPDGTWAMTERKPEAS